MDTLFISKLEPFLNAVSGEMALFVPEKKGENFIYKKYSSDTAKDYELNNIRSCEPVKEFLFPIREIAAGPPENPTEDIKPFAVFGIKQCDLAAIEILDKVFLEEDFEDIFYKARRDNVFIISSDCYDPGEFCFCNVMGGKSFAEKMFDLNVVPIKDGFIVEVGSKKGTEFVKKHEQLFGDVPEALLNERDENREKVEKQLQELNESYHFDKTIKEIVEQSHDSEVFDEESKDCVECQACTRVCPTCHCFYLYDTKHSDYYAKAKIWDSCVRLSYARVAGGANPNKVLGDRLKHRFMHKFVYFLERYGINMCVGCGRCIQTCAGDRDIRNVLKKLSEEVTNISTK